MNVKMNQHLKHFLENSGKRDFDARNKNKNVFIESSPKSEKFSIDTSKTEINM